MLSVATSAPKSRQTTEGDWKWRCFLDIETLDCPICAEPLSVPVYQCQNGHPICSVCSTKVGSKGCPSCFRPTGHIRCLAVEKIAESLLVPCKHGSHGCQEMLRYNNRDARDEHEKQACKFQPFPCPLPLCSHKGPLAAFSTHLADAHGVRRTKFTHEEAHPFRREHFRVLFRMSSEESCMMIDVEKPAGSSNSDSDSDVVAQARVRDGVLIVAHREKEGDMGDWFFCTAYGVGLDSMTYKLRVMREDSRFGTTKHKLKALVHDSSRESVRADRGFVDRLLVPFAGRNLPRLFDVQVTVFPNRRMDFVVDSRFPCLDVDCG